jgi:SAM-dependent methyltransferase
MAARPRQVLDAARKRLADALAPGLDGAPGDGAPGLPPDGALIDRLAERDVELEDRLRASGPLKRELAAILTDDEAAELTALADPDWLHALSVGGPHDLRAGLIAVGLSRGLMDLERRTGLSAAMPPQDVHSMTHDAERSAGGDPFYADLVATALEECGLSLAAGHRVLDLGCSSGRVVRMLAARRPEATWAGCDVNAAAIAWASEALPAIDFAVQPLRPPLPYADGSFDAVFAISIWSHYNADSALQWLDELHRIIAPGGLALITTHGPGAIAKRSSAIGHGEGPQRDLLVQLYRRGFAFVDSFGPGGDWGVVDHDWGTSFMTPEWLLSHVTPNWSAPLYRPAAIDGHQDLWILRREA